jgi:hypothetical protein
LLLQAQQEWGPCRYLEAWRHLLLLLQAWDWQQLLKLCLH